MALQEPDQQMQKPINHHDMGNLIVLNFWIMIF